MPIPNLRRQAITGVDSLDIALAIFVGSLVLSAAALAWSLIRAEK